MLKDEHDFANIFKIDTHVEERIGLRNVFSYWCYIETEEK